MLSIAKVERDADAVSLSISLCVFVCGIQKGREKRVHISSHERRSAHVLHESRIHSNNNLNAANSDRTITDECDFFFELLICARDAPQPSAYDAQTFLKFAK